MYIVYRCLKKVKHTLLDSDPDVWKRRIRSEKVRSATHEYDNKVCLLIQPEREPEQEPEPTTALQPWLLPDGVGLD